MQLIKTMITVAVTSLIINMNGTQHAAFFSGQV